MRFLLTAILFACALLPLHVFAQESPIAKLPWEYGPTTGAIGNIATIKVPKGYAFLGVEGTRQLNVILENPPSGSDVYTLAPESLSWIAFFAFNQTGYIKDTDKLDSDAILQSVKEGTEQGNIERRKNGWAPLKIVGWSFEPKYDNQIKSLEWAILAQSEGANGQVVNYNTRLLGRKGVMEVVVVTAPNLLDSSIATFKGLLPTYQFTAGETYAEYRAGDHVAEYGLAALITGGAAAVAAKKGLFGVIAGFLAAAWKFVIAGLIGLGAWFKSLFSRKKKVE